MSVVTGQVKVSISTTQAPATSYAGGGQTVFLVDEYLGNGSAAGTIQKCAKSTGTIGTGANVDVDLSTLTDANGTAISTGEVRILIIDWSGSSDGSLEVKGSASNGWVGATGLLADVSDKLIIPKTGRAVLDASQQTGGWVTDGTHKSINLKNNGSGTGTYVLTVIGT